MAKFSKIQWRPLVLKTSRNTSPLLSLLRFLYEFRHFAFLDNRKIHHFPVFVRYNLGTINGSSIYLSPAGNGWAFFMPKP